jgi:squalene-hopene/tetraprenyl-beta-curcumene cyclase
MSSLIEHSDLRGRADTALNRAVEAMWKLQRADGSWEGELASSPVATGAAAIAMHFVDPDGCADLIERAVAWLRTVQRPDGGWGDTPAGPSTLGGTTIGIAALRLTGPAGSADPATEAGLTALDRLGGRAYLRDLNRSPMYVVCQHYLYWAGLWPEAPAHRIPFEAILLPRFVATKMSFALPTIAAFGIMQSRTGDPGAVRRAVDRLAERRAFEVLEEMIEFEGTDGCFEESAFVAAVISVGLFRAGVGDAIVRRCMNYMRATVRADGSWPVDRDLELSCTSYVTTGLQDAGLAGDPRLIATERWIRASQRTEPFAITGCPPGGWGWARPSAWPDTDDTSLALTALGGFGRGPGDRNVDDGLAWLHRMQSRNGAWSCFIRNGRRQLDGPCSALTAHALIALTTAGGATADAPAVSRAVRWLASAQQPGGALRCQWFRGRTMPTARALTVLARLGLADEPTARGLAGWLAGHAESDGGWGDGDGSPASAEETAWAVIGLQAAGHDGPVADGVDWLVRRQRTDGTWSPSEVGVYFPQLTYWCDHMANGHVIQALAGFNGRRTASDGTV